MNDSPTADFLAREHAILGEDAALFGNTFAQLDSHTTNTSTPIHQDHSFINGFDSTNQSHSFINGFDSLNQSTIPSTLPMHQSVSSTMNQFQSQFAQAKQQSDFNAPIHSFETGQMSQV